MKPIREHLQSGTGRLLFSSILACVVVAVTWRYWPTDLKRSSEILSSVQKVAFVTMAFAVTAYNLRTRVIDLILKGSYKPDHAERLSKTARDCGRRLTGLVLLFTIASTCMGVGVFFDFSIVTARYSAVVSAALFGYSLVSFIYILFAFERLERFILDQAVDDARKKEIERLTSSAS